MFSCFFLSFFLKSSSCRLSSSWNRNKKSKVPIETTSSAPIFHSAKKQQTYFILSKTGHNQTRPCKTRQVIFNGKPIIKSEKYPLEMQAKHFFWLLERLRLSLFSGNPFRIMTYLERVGMAVIV